MLIRSVSGKEVDYLEGVRLGVAFQMMKWVWHSEWPELRKAPGKQERS